MSENPDLYGLCGQLFIDGREIGTINGTSIDCPGIVSSESDALELFQPGKIIDILDSQGRSARAEIVDVIGNHLNITYQVGPDGYIFDSPKINADIISIKFEKRKIRIRQVVDKEFNTSNNRLIRIGRRQG